MDKAPTLSTLYAAATESLVSDASASSTFEKMIHVAFSHATVETFSKDLRETEAIIKKEFEIGAMPGPWRSSKSVICGAMKLGIGLTDDNGGFVGKSYLQAKIKEMKDSATKDEISMDDYVNRLWVKLCVVPAHLDAKEVRDQINRLIVGM
jgi:hypothetical protein